MIALHSHLDDGALGYAMLNAPLVLVSALSAVGNGRAYKAEEDRKAREAKAKAEARSKG